ncbi:hypothetical protein E4T38_01336 [Aureobasidium subglaciale]|nr:hypothetical protein E4T38_01336 [Aureobasidium subglaciale]KAI5229648.1 hypothetical protein E4T40_01337 [Aureobasidium subglaciale]KAI5233438.1 hypothetical protein E4T41_01335 [Aureobasidium subglaciale]KAI5266653.1 hypothetical protein E4T46_01336 [Aureobasidium subglaciale]
MCMVWPTAVWETRQQRILSGSGRYVHRVYHKRRERRQRNGDRANSPPNPYGHNPRNGLLPNSRPQTQPPRPLGGLAQWPRPVAATVSNMVPQARPHDDLGVAADPPRTNSKRVREEDTDDMDVLLTARLELKDGRNIRRNENQVKKLKQHKDIAKVTLEDYSTEPAKEIATYRSIPIKGKIKRRKK